MADCNFNVFAGIEMEQCIDRDGYILSFLEAQKLHQRAIAIQNREDYIKFSQHIEKYVWIYRTLMQAGLILWVLGGLIFLLGE